MGNLQSELTITRDFSPNEMRSIYKNTNSKFVYNTVNNNILNSNMTGSPGPFGSGSPFQSFDAAAKFGSAQDDHASWKQCHRSCPVGLI